MVDQAAPLARALEFVPTRASVCADAFGINGFYRILGSAGATWCVVCPRGAAMHYEDYLPTQAAAKRWAQEDFEARVQAELARAPLASAPLSRQRTPPSSSFTSTKGS